MTNSRPSVSDKRSTYRALHKSGCFVIPNPWNVGTARYLQGLGFKALATTSSGFAHSEGMPDGAPSRDMVLAHLREIVEATDVPVNADFEGGYADDPDGVAESVRLAVATGVAGLSIEDSTGNADRPALRFRPRARPRARRPRGDRQGGRRRGLHGAQRGLHLRATRSRRDDPPAQGLRGRRRRLPLSAGHQDARAGHRRRQGGRAAAGQPADDHQRVHRQGDCRHGRAPHQRRRHAGARRHERLHPVRHARSPSRASSTASPASSPTRSSTPSSARTASAGRRREPQRRRPDHRPADRPARRHDARRPASRRRARRALRARREARPGPSRRRPVGRRARPRRALDLHVLWAVRGRFASFPPGSTSAQSSRIRIRMWRSSAPAAARSASPP